MRSAAIVLAAAAFLLPAGVILAQAAGASPAPAAPYELSWWTVDGGGYTWSTGGTYSLGGTIGQPDAGDLARGDYALGGGFWEPAGGYDIYLPLVIKW